MWDRLLQFFEHVVFLWRTRGHVFDPLTRKELVHFFCEAASRDEGIEKAYTSVLNVTLRGMAIPQQQRRYFLQGALKHSRGIGLPKPKAVEVCVDYGTIPEGPSRLIAETLRSVLMDECKRYGFDQYLRAIIVSGQPLFSAERWARRGWKDVMNSPYSGTWSGQAPRTNLLFAGARYLVIHKPWIVKVFAKDPIKRDCIVVTIPCGDEQKRISETLNIRRDMFRWELLQPIVVRFHTRRFSSWLLVRRVRRRLRSVCMPRASRQLILGCCTTIHEMIIRLEQDKFWESSIESLREPLGVMLRKPRSRYFLLRKVLIEALFFAAQADNATGDSLPLKFYQSLAEILEEEPERVQEAIEEFVQVFRGLDYYSCKITRLAQCTASLLKCESLGKAVFTASAIDNVLRLSGLQRSS